MFSTRFSDDHYMQRLFAALSCCVLSGVMPPDVICDGTTNKKSWNLESILVRIIIGFSWLSPFGMRSCAPSVANEDVLTTTLDDYSSHCTICLYITQDWDFLPDILWGRSTDTRRAVAIWHLRNDLGPCTQSIPPYASSDCQRSAIVPLGASDPERHPQLY